MKFLSIIFCILFTIIPGLSAMEIEHARKNNEQKYIPLLDTTPLSIKCEAECWIYHIKTTPPEVRALIYKTVFDTSPEIATKLAALPTEKLLRFFYEMRPHLPVTIGNKNFTVLDLFTLTPEQKETIFSMKNNKFFSEDDIKLLQNNLPAHIKQDMVVSQKILSCFEKSGVCPTIAGGSCGTGGMGIGVTSTMIGCATGCKSSPIWWIPGGIGLLACVLIPGIALCIYCTQEHCCNKEIQSIPLNPIPQSKYCSESSTDSD